MSQAPQAVTTTANREGLPVSDVADPELLALPAPPRGRRFLAMTLMAAVVVGSGALIAQIRSDVAYFFAPDIAVDLGQARERDPRDMPTNVFVRVRGTPMLSKMVSYTVPLTGTEQAVFPLLGQRHLFVQVPLADLRDPDRGTRGEFFGRLVTFSALRGRMDSVQQHLHDAMALPVTSESFVLIADEAPENYLWAPLLSAVCVAFILFTVWMMLRWFRPLPVRS